MRLQKMDGIVHMFLIIISIMSNNYFTFILPESPIQIKIWRELAEVAAAQIYDVKNTTYTI